MYEFACAGVVAIVAGALLDLLDDYGSVDACVLSDLAQRLLDGLGHDMDTGGLVIVVALESFKSCGGTYIGNSASGQIALLYSCTCGVQRILDAVLLLLHLHFGGSSHIKYRHAACEFAEPLLELLLVIVGGAGLDLLADGVHALLDGSLVAGSADDGGVLLGDGHPLGLSEHVGRRVLEGEAPFFRNDYRAGEGCDVLKHLLAAVAEAGSLDGGDLQRSAKLVDHQGGESLAVDVLGDDEQLLAFTGDRLENREKVLHRGYLLVAYEYRRIGEHGLHLVSVGHEVGRNIAAVELHALDNLDLGLGALGLLDCDHAVLAHL